MNTNLILMLSLLVIVLLVLFINTLREGFESKCALGNIHPDKKMAEFLGKDGEASNDNDNANDNANDDTKEVNLDNYVRKSGIERAARSAALTYCPVSPNYDPSQYVKKTEIPNETKCPKLPDLKDYVLKSTIPPASKCPDCICPKVKVSAGLCKKCPSPDEICPKPKACTVEQCRSVIKCPEPKPCMNKPANCPPPKPCPVPPPCPSVVRCPPHQCPKCKFYGIKDAPQKSLEEQLKDLLNSDDPNKKVMLNKLKELLGIEKCEHYENNNTNSPAEEPTPTMTTDFKSTEGIVIDKVNAVNSYNNRCVNNSPLYNAVGVLQSRFN